MLQLSIFILRIASVACRTRFGHWDPSRGFECPCLLEEAADALEAA